MAPIAIHSITDACINTTADNSLAKQPSSAMKILIYYYNRVAYLRILMVKLVQYYNTYCNILMQVP